MRNPEKELFEAINSGQRVRYEVATDTYRISVWLTSARWSGIGIPGSYRKDIYLCYCLDGKPISSVSILNVTGFDVLRENDAVTAYTVSSVSGAGEEVQHIFYLERPKKDTKSKSGRRIADAEPKVSDCE